MRREGCLWPACVGAQRRPTRPGDTHTPAHPPLLSPARCVPPQPQRVFPPRWLLRRSLGVERHAGIDRPVDAAMRALLQPAPGHVATPRRHGRRTRGCVACVSGGTDRVYPCATPHSGYHFDGQPRKFFEGWYFRVTLPSRPGAEGAADSFAIMYSIEDPMQTGARSGVVRVYSALAELLPSCADGCPLARPPCPGRPGHGPWRRVYHPAQPRRREHFLGGAARAGAGGDIQARRQTGRRVEESPETSNKSACALTAPTPWACVHQRRRAWWTRPCLTTPLWRGSRPPPCGDRRVTAQKAALQCGLCLSLSLTPPSCLNAGPPSRRQRHRRLWAGQHRGPGVVELLRDSACWLGRRAWAEAAGHRRVAGGAACV